MVRQISSSTSGPSGPASNPSAPLKLRFQRFSSFVDEYASYLSLGGMFVKTATPAPVGSQVSFEVELADGYRLLRGQGQVAWRRLSAPAPGLPAGMAIRFQALDDAGRELVLKILEEQVKGGGSPFDVDEVPPGAESVPPHAASPAPSAAPRATAHPRVRDSGFDAPWGDQLPEVPADVLDDSGSMSEPPEPLLEDAEDRDEISFYAAAEQAAQELEEFSTTESLDGEFELIEEDGDADLPLDFAFEVDGAELTELALDTPGDSGTDDEEPTVVNFGRRDADEEDEPTVVGSSRPWDEAEDDEEPTLVTSHREGEDPFDPPTRSRAPTPQGVLAAPASPASTAQVRMVTDVRQSQAAEGLSLPDHAFAPTPAPVTPSEPVGSAFGRWSAREAAIPRPPAESEIGFGSAPETDVGEPKAQPPASFLQVQEAPPAIDSSSDAETEEPGEVLDYDLDGDEPRRRAVSPKLAVAAVILLSLAGGAYFFSDRLFGGRGAERSAPTDTTQQQAEQAASIDGDAADERSSSDLSGVSSQNVEPALPVPATVPVTVPVSEPTEDTGESSAEAPDASRTSTVAAPAAVPLQRSQESSFAGGPATEVTSISYQQTSDGTVVIVHLDGELTSARVVHDPLAWAAAREQVAITGIQSSYRLSTLVIGSPELKQVRTGLHRDSAGSELRLVFDLGQPEASLTDVSTDGTQLKVLVQLP